ncbi:predicted protein [Histoplasma capsulatum var. duboisii H88]|uniref:Predicted protein n=1 Tax=Ajellomyces capsulatus (strain H88) TaxID=544711 RepID=F0UCZ2_AJEC8|nr:predicted protein [Histoplasma capsulatum var. duboisii H88]
MRKSDGVTKRGMVTTIPWITEDILFTVKMKYIQLQRYYCDNASCDANDASSPAKTSGDLFGPSSTQKRQRHITTDITIVQRIKIRVYCSIPQISSKGGEILVLTHSLFYSLNGVNVAWSSILVFKGWQMECTLDV